MSEDWLDTSPEASSAGLPAVIVLPGDYASRAALAEDCWSRLTTKQKLFLQAWRENGFNGRAAQRQTQIRRHLHSRSLLQRDYATIVAVWQANAAASALDKDRLLARHDGIVEQLLEPKPVLYQGAPVRDPRDPLGITILEEVDAGAAGRANEVLLQAAGVLKSGKDVEVNVGVAIHEGPPTLTIQVMPSADERKKESQSVVIDAKFTEVPDGGDWLA